jgi:hypothetical protein
MEELETQQGEEAEALPELLSARLRLASSGRWLPPDDRMREEGSNPVLNGALERLLLLLLLVVLPLRSPSSLSQSERDEGGTGRMKELEPPEVPELLLRRTVQ